MRTRAGLIALALILTTTSVASLMAMAPDVIAMSQPADDQAPSSADIPGNPVVGDDRPGDFASTNTTNYAAWSLVAACLILAGSLLVKIERWEARRIPQPDPGSR